jgi:hypothetical protein
MFVLILVTSASISYFPVVTPDKCHLLYIRDFKLTVDYLHNSLTPHHNYAQGDYQLLYDTLINL